MNKNIGILTSAQSFSDNYGAVLQAYALCKVLKNKGYSPKIIRYKVEGEYVNHSAPIIERLKNTLFNPDMSIKAKTTLIINKLTHKSVANVFNEFTNENLIFYNEEYLTFEQLQASPPDFFAFITGSDQVWNPVIHGNKNDPGYFLKFVPSGKKRVAYAPSMGVSEIPKECEKTLSDFVEGFDALSIREISGAQIIKKCCGIDVPVVLDPTLLLTVEQWKEVSIKKKDLPDEYIFCYKFGKSENMNTTIKEISKKYRLPIVAAPAFAGSPFKADYTIGPGEFLYAVENAKIICTDSFHASVFSIIFNKPFLTFPRHTEAIIANMNSRMQGLLDTMKLSNRYVCETDTVDFDNLFSVDFSEAEEKICCLRENAFEYLDNALK